MVILLYDRKLGFFTTTFYLREIKRLRFTLIQGERGGGKRGGGRERERERGGERGEGRERGGGREERGEQHSPV